MLFLLGCNHPSFAAPWRSLLPYLAALHLLQLGSDPFSMIILYWTVALAVIITILVGSFVINVFLHRKKVTQSRELKRKDAELVEKAAALEGNDAALAELPVILEILASKLMKQMEKLDIRNSLLKKQYEKTEILAEQLEKHSDEMVLCVAELKKYVAALEKRTEALEKPSKEQD